MARWLVARAFCFCFASSVSCMVHMLFFWLFSTRSLFVWTLRSAFGWMDETPRAKSITVRVHAIEMGLRTKGRLASFPCLLACFFPSFPRASTLVTVKEQRKNVPGVSLAVVYTVSGFFLSLLALCTVFSIFNYDVQSYISRNGHSLHLSKSMRVWDGENLNVKM